jgi:hypothetical protein
VTQVVARALAKQVQCSELKLQYYQKKFKWKFLKPYSLVTLFSSLEATNVTNYVILLK